MVTFQRCRCLLNQQYLTYIIVIAFFSCQCAVVERTSKMATDAPLDITTEMDNVTEESDDVTVENDNITTQVLDNDDTIIHFDDRETPDFKELKEAAIFQDDDGDNATDRRNSRNSKPIGSVNWWPQVSLPSFLTVVKFKNDPCSSTSTFPERRGTCYTKKECLSKRGVPVDKCALGFGQCCVFSKTCGDVMTENCTYFTNPEYDWGQTYMPNGQETCELKVVKCRPDICQLRLDFEDFEIFGIENGICGVDNFVSIGGSSIPTMCGQNTGQHMYINIPPTMKKIKLQLNLDSLAIPGITDRLNRRWKIKVTQIECSSPNLAPPGCCQYFTERTGKITSYNFGTDVTQSTAGYPNNLNYGVCIKKITGYCSIRYSQNTQFQFGVNPNDVTGGYTGADCGTFGNPGDYVIIPNAQPQNDRYCGGGFPAGGVETQSMPYVLTVVSDSLSYGEGGFMLDYRQQPC